MVISSAVSGVRRFVLALLLVVALLVPAIPAAGVPAVLARGTVTAAEGGAPISGAQVFVYSYDAGTDEYGYLGFEYTAANGGYEVSDYDRGAGDYWLSVSANGFVGGSADISWGGGAPLTRNFQLEARVFESIAVHGANRFETAVQASQMAFSDGTCSTAIIASGRNFPDALGASALAGALFCPVLLTEPGSLPGVIKDEVLRLGATEIIIVGGTSAVSDTVMNQLEALPGRTVERIAGDNRYETARLVAERTVAEAGPWYNGYVFLATGTDFPDALAAAPLAAWAKRPILLVKPDAIPSATAAAFDTLAVQGVQVLGGEAAVGPDVYQSLEDKFEPQRVTRIHGANRYATAAAIAQYGVDNLGLKWDGVGFATGLNYPDALAGGAVQGLHGSVILLTRPTRLESAPEQKLIENAFSIYEVRYYGGARAIAQPVRDQIRAVVLTNQ